MKMNKFGKVSVALVLTMVSAGFLVFFGGNARASAQSERPDESYAVYSALLGGMASSPENGEKIELLVINRNTVVNSFSKMPPTEPGFRARKVALSNEFKLALADYNVQNRKSEELTAKFDLTTKYTLIAQSEYQAFFKSNNLRQDWEAFYRKYPKSPGFISFSRVGFDPERKHAFVYREIYCGSLCADGSYFLLENNDGTWKVTKQIWIWAS